MKKLDLKSFVKDESLIINEYHWQELNSSYSKDELKYAISDAIEGLPLPLLPITEKDAKDDFKKLQAFSSRKLLRKSELFTKAEYQYDLSNWYLSNALVGRDSSNYFHQEARWNVKHAKFSSPVASWTEKKLHKELNYKSHLPKP